MEELEALLINFQEHYCQFSAIESREQNIEWGFVEMDSKIRAKHKVEVKVLDHVGAWEDWEGNKWIKEIDEKHGH